MTPTSAKQHGFLCKVSSCVPQHVQCDKDAVLVIDQIRKGGIGQAENRNKKEKKTGSGRSVAVTGEGSWQCLCLSAGPQRTIVVPLILIDLSRSSELWPR